MKDKELLQKAIDEGDFALAQQLLNQIKPDKNNTIKRGRLSKIEINQIQTLSLQGKNANEIATTLNRSVDSITKYFKTTKEVKEVKEEQFLLRKKGNSGRVQFINNTFHDSGQEARADKKIDKLLSGSSPKTERRDKPVKVLSTCSGCNKQEKISPLLANSDPDSRTIYHICSTCIKVAKGKVAP